MTAVATHTARATPGVSVAGVVDRPPTDWDARVVASPGGHVLQGTAWAEHRRRQGWQPLHVTFSDGRAALVLRRRRPLLPGYIAYAPRGPVAAGDPPRQVAGRAVALADWVAGDGGTLLVVDPELDADPEYDTLLAARGFRETEEIQATRHRLVLELPPGTTEERLLAGIAKSTRQRIRAAERAGTVAAEDAAGSQLDAFGEFLAATARRKEFYVGDVGAAASWWRRAMAAGQARFFAARNGAALLGGLIVYLQGGHVATAYSADDAASREAFPGTMHLLRWTAIRHALAAGCPSIDLGGVDLPGARRRPLRGERCHGLLEHKTSFGAQWVDSTAAHEIVLRPGLHRAAAAVGALARMGRGRRVGAARGDRGAGEGGGDANRHG